MKKSRVSKYQERRKSTERRYLRVRENHLSAKIKEDWEIARAPILRERKDNQSDEVAGAPILRERESHLSAKITEE